MTTLRPIFQAAAHVEWSQFEGLAALRCTVGVAITLGIGLALGQPLVSAFGAIGAVSVGFGSFQGAYRSRAEVMIYAAAAIALSVFVGSVAGHSGLAASGLLVAVGPAAAFVGLQSVVAVLIAGGYPTSPASAAVLAAIVLGGGLVQTLLVVRPEFHDTFARGIARITGTVAGAALATLIVHVFAPWPIALNVVVLAFVWGCYALFRMNYAFFTVCLTGYIVFILMISGVAEMTAATTRALYTLEGGALALCVYAVWPTWAASSAREALGAMLDEHSAYVETLLRGYADPRAIDLEEMSRIRSRARLARSNAEAIVERMLAEPASRASIKPRVAVGLLAALRRHSLGALARHAGLERGVHEPVLGMDQLAAQMTAALASLAAAVRSGAAPDPLPDLRRTQLALEATEALVNEETDLMVDSVKTVASLLSP